MRKMVSVMFGAALLLGANGALAQAFGAKGTPAVSADRLFGFSTIHDNEEFPAPVNADVETDSTHFAVVWPGGAFASPYDIPRGAFDFFVIDGLSIGGSIGYASVSQERQNTNDVDRTAFVFAPRVGYVWMFNNWAGFWIRGGFTYHSIKQDIANGPETGESAFALTIEPTFVLAPTANFGFVVGPTADLTFTGEREYPGADNDFSYLSFGILRAGLIGWF